MLFKWLKSIFAGPTRTAPQPPPPPSAVPCTWPSLSVPQQRLLGDLWLRFSPNLYVHHRQTPFQEKQILAHLPVCRTEEEYRYQGLYLQQMLIPNSEC